MSFDTQDSNTSLWQFIKAVWRQWRLLMSGCGLVVLLGVFEHFSGKNIPLEVYIGILALLICVSFYFAWREERTTKNRTEQVVLGKDKVISESQQTISELRQTLLQVKETRTPLLKATILEVFTGELSGQGEKQTGVTYKITISNLGMPSVVVDWMPFITLVGRKPLAFEYMHFENLLTLGHEGGRKATVIKSQDMIYEKTSVPIQTGAMVVGFLHFWSSYKRDDIRARETILGVLFKDVNEVIYEVHYDKENSKTLPAPRYTPGVQTRTTTINKSTPRRKKRK